MKNLLLSAVFLPLTVLIVVAGAVQHGWRHLTGGSYPPPVR